MQITVGGQPSRGASNNDHTNNEVNGEELNLYTEILADIGLTTAIRRVLKIGCSMTLLL